VNSANPDERPRPKVGSSSLALSALVAALFGSPIAEAATGTSSASPGNPAARLFGPDPKSPLAIAAGLLDKSDFAGAAKLLKGYSGPAAEVAPWLEARALAGLGHRDDALKVLAARPARNLGCATIATDPLSIEPAVLAANLLAGTQPEEAAKRLLALPPDGPRFAQAIGLLAKNPTAQRAAETRLLEELPEDLASLALAEKLGVEGIKARLDNQRRRARAQKLLDAHANDAAKAEATSLMSEP
jgi:hypothetical protein